MCFIACSFLGYAIVPGSFKDHVTSYLAWLGCMLHFAILSIKKHNEMYFFELRIRSSAFLSVLVTLKFYCSGINVTCHRDEILVIFMKFIIVVHIVGIHCLWQRWISMFDCFWYFSVLELVDAAIPLQELDPFRQTIQQVEGVKASQPSLLHDQ